MPDIKQYQRDVGFQAKSEWKTQVNISNMYQNSRKAAYKISNHILGARGTLKQICPNKLKPGLNRIKVPPSNLSDCHKIIKHSLEHCNKIQSTYIIYNISHIIKKLLNMPHTQPTKKKKSPIKSEKLARDKTVNRSRSEMTYQICDLVDKDVKINLLIW